MEWGNPEKNVQEFKTCSDCGASYKRSIGACPDCFPQHEPRDPLLVEREKTHGNFAQQARCAQDIKAFLRVSPKWNYISGPQKEALEMIAVKISRITYGDFNYKDSWKDIAGYAKLGAEACEK